MKLIQINPEHYIVVDDSEIKEGDLVTNGNYITQAVNEWWTKFYNGGNKKDFWKITHSTQPLEDIEVDKYVTRMPIYDKIQQITLSEVKELIGEVDVEKKAREEVDRYTISTSSIDLKAKIQRFQGYMKGYKQALEDNKEKKYTEEGLRKAIKMSFDGSTFKEIIQSLQLKTEWEIEIVDGKLKLK